MSTYDNLRRQCRTLESLLDAKLTSYSRLAANAEREDLEASGSSDRWMDLEEEVDGLLEKVCCVFTFLPFTVIMTKGNTTKSLEKQMTS